MRVIPHRFRSLSFLLPCLVALLGLVGSLGVALRAPPGTLRVAVLSWDAVARSGLPVVQVAAGGWLIVVDGTGQPERLAQLRAASLVVLDAARVPGCSAAPVTMKVRGADASDA